MPRLLASGSGVLGGSSFIVWLVGALGAAMFVGNMAAILRPPTRPKEGDVQRAPVLRSAVFAGLGAVVALWALASLVSG